MKYISNIYELNGLYNKPMNYYINVKDNEIEVYSSGNFKNPFVTFEFNTSWAEILQNLDFDVDKLVIHSYDDLYKLNNVSNYNGYRLKVEHGTTIDADRKSIDKWLMIFVIDELGKMTTLYEHLYKDSKDLESISDVLKEYGFDTISMDINIILSSRDSYIPKWDHYFMSIAELTALRSKDINTKVGSVIVDNENKIKSIGYNGFPTGIDESKIPKGREGNPIDTKYPYVVHSEANALLNGNNDYKDCTIYTTLFPCNECAKLICQSGIKRVIYLSDKYKDSDMNKVAKMLFDYSGVSYFYIGDSYKGLKDIVNNLL